jgi:D-alanyl-D-alanine carboxypeptidase/D-alanyl-D-alanine-endopeptidase (penicillin-binding protein 4)
MIHRISYKNIFFWLVLLLAFTVKAQNTFDEIFDAFKKDPALKHSSFALLVSDPKQNKPIFSYNAQLSLIPASTLKLLTTSAALHILGENYQYKTYVAISGTVSDSVLKGNLVIIGSGDPTLGSENFEECSAEKILSRILEAVKKLGIKKIEGNIVADVSIFDEAPTPANWLWVDIGNYFGSGPSGLNFVDNKVKVFFRSGKNQGDSTAIIKTIPKVDDLKISNQVTVGAEGSGDNTYFYGAEFQNLRVARGTIPPNKESFEVSCSMPDPALYMMQELKNYLIKHQIAVSGEATTTRILNLMGFYKKYVYQYIDSILSPPLKQIVYYTNLKSINLYAETLLKTLALITANQGTTANGIKVVENFLNKANIATDGLKLSDGSGLSPMNRITAYHLTALLNYMYNLPCFKSFENSLPVAGKSGSLASMFKNSFADNNLRAKSGYINNVRSYAGYYVNKSGQLRSFTFLINNYDISAGEMKRKMELLMIKMTEGL